MKLMLVGCSNNLHGRKSNKSSEKVALQRLMFEYTNRKVHEVLSIIDGVRKMNFVSKCYYDQLYSYIHTRTTLNRII